MQICSSCFRARHENDNTDDRHNRLDKWPRDREFKTTFYCCGRIPLEGPNRKRHGMLETLQEDFRSDSSVELAVEAYEDEIFGLKKITNPSVPFVGDIPEELYEGRSIEVQGKLLENVNRFSINLSTGDNNDSDLALHFNPRFDRHVIIRNHRIRNKWGVEEITSLRKFPFTLGRNFSVLIFVADEQFLIAINKIHYCAFAFRLPVDRIKSLIILGDLTLNQILHCDKSQYPPKIFKKTPYIIVPYTVKAEYKKCLFRRKIKKIENGTRIEISGRLKILPRAFYVNIQNGISVWPHPIIPFHMNYRLHPPGTRKKEKEIIFNSWLDGVWGKEEVISYCPFLPGTPFHITIICQSNGYCLYVNDKLLYNFNRRSEVYVDSVVIHGDVVINRVTLH